MFSKYVGRLLTFDFFVPIYRDFTSKLLLNRGSYFARHTNKSANKNALKTKFILIFFVPLLLFLGLVQWFSGARASPSLICNVPNNYPTIQAAVNDTNCTDVNIGSGTFYENVNITRAVNIHGQGSNLTTVDGTANGNVFHIDGRSTATMNVSLEELRIINGSSNNGGGIHNLEATLNLTNTIVSGNASSGMGGGIYSDLGVINIFNSDVSYNTADTGGGIYVASGMGRILNSSIVNNYAGHHAGGLFISNQSTVHLEMISVTGNTTYVDGGGIFNDGTMTINNSSIDHNKSTNYSGGGIRNQGTANINNTTVSNNRAVIDEAGIDNHYGTLRLSSSTVANNIGGGIRSHNSNVRIQNSIVSGNSPDDCRGTIRSNGYNIVKDSSNCDFLSGIGDLVDTSANLGALTGEPGYHPLLTGPGINSGNPAGCTNHQRQVLMTDQRGSPRVGRCDIGAYEYQDEFHQNFLPIHVHNYCPDLFDDFSNPLSGWPDGENEYVRAGYLNNEYRVRSKNANYYYLFKAPSCDRDNYVVEVDARWVGEPGNGYGIIFGVSNDYSHSYLFDINTDFQMYRLLYSNPSELVGIVYPTTSNAIKSGNQTNHMKVTRNGSQIILEVNGTTLGTFNDNSISGLTGAGIVLSPYNDRADSQARFDNFSMSQVSKSGNQAQGSNADLDKLVPKRYDTPPNSDLLNWDAHVKE